MPNLYFKDTGYYLKRKDDIYGPKSRVNYAFTKAIELLEKTSDYDA